MRQVFRADVRWRFGDAHVLGATMAIAPPIAVVAPLGLAPLSVLAALCIAFVRFRDGWKQPRIPPVPLALFGILGLLGLASVLWSIAPSTSLARLPPLLGAIVCGLLLLDAAISLDSAARGRVGKLLLGGMVVALTVLIVERTMGFPLRHLASRPTTNLIDLQNAHNRGLALVSLLIWPAALMLWPRDARTASLLVLAAFGTLLGFVNGAAQLAVLAGAAIFAAGCLWPRATPTALAAIMIVYIAAAPILHARVVTADVFGLRTASGEFKDGIVARSGYHRLLIWHFAADHIAQRPISGWGLDASREMPGRETKLDSREEALPLHPHNAVLQLWLELGLGGAMLLAVLIAWMLSRVRAAPWPRADRAAATATIAAAFIIANLSYGIWQSWWLATLFLAAACAVAVAGRHESHYRLDTRPDTSCP